MKKKTANKVSVGHLKDSDDSLITDDEKMANLLNTFFCSVFTRERVERPENEHLFMGEGELEYMEFQAGKVKKKLKELKPSAAPGPERVWPECYKPWRTCLPTPC